MLVSALSPCPKPDIDHARPTVAKRKNIDPLSLSKAPGAPRSARLVAIAPQRAGPPMDSAAPRAAPHNLERLTATQSVAKNSCASEALYPAGDRLVTSGDITSDCPGDFVGIALSPLQ